MDSDKKTLAAPPLGLMVDRPVTTSSSQPSFGGRFVRRLKRLDVVFILCVLIPTLLAGFYYGFVASEIYISESSFVVESVQDQGSSSSGFSALLKSAASGASDQDTASVQEFMESRDALQSLEKQMDMRRALGSDKVDPIARFGGYVWWDKSFEALFRFYTKKVVSIGASEASSSISELKVSAFTPGDAATINRKLLEMGEKLVNTLNNRLQDDLVKYADGKVKEAAVVASKAYGKLADYRGQHNLVDPELQAKNQLTLLMNLEHDLVDANNQLFQLKTSVANSPAIPALDNKVKSLQQQIDLEMGKATGTDANSFTGKASDYEELIFGRDFAQKQLTEAMGYLEKSRNDAQRKQLYLERIVEPNTPDVAVEPRGARNTLATLVLGLIVWGVIRLFVAGVREHQQ